MADTTGDFMGPWANGVPSDNGSMVTPLPNPNSAMGLAGSTLGAGMTSPMNLTPSPMTLPGTKKANWGAVSQGLKQLANQMPQNQVMSPSQFGVQMAQTPAQQVPTIPNPVVANPLQAQYPGLGDHITRVTTR